MTTCVFLGPTLSLDAARAALDAIYLPPARRGDILRAVETYAPDTIVLIDGYFEQAAAVWHKEILWALREGVTVCGAASMGALRAADLAQFGMIGMGRIFDAYMSGTYGPFDDPFDGDDEVAILHGPAEIGYLPVTEAMADIRDTLAEAKRAQVITEVEMTTIAARAKSTFYKRRTWPTLLDIASPALRDWVAANHISRKSLDATHLLGEVRRGVIMSKPPPFRFERTLLWEQMAPGFTPERG